MSYVPVITRIRQGIEDWLAAESAAGRITPPIASFPKVMDIERHDAYPAVVTRVVERVHEGGHQYMGRLDLELYLTEPRDELADTEIENFEMQILGALNREYRDYGGLARGGVGHIRTRFSDTYMRRDESEYLRAAQIQLAVAFNEVHGETT